MVQKHILEQILEKEHQHSELQAKTFNQLDFDERVIFFKLKAELGKLYLNAADESRDLKARGEYLRNVVKYNPFLKPKIAVPESQSRAVGDLLPRTKPATLSQETERSRQDNTAFIGATVLFIPAFLVLAIPYIAYKLSPAERVAQLLYVKTHCLFELPADVPAEECLSTAVAHLDAGRNFVAIRYLLEAEIRSTSINPEISLYFSCCIDGLRSSSDSGYQDENLLWTRLAEIKNKVMRDREMPLSSQLQFIWELGSDFSWFPDNELLATLRMKLNGLGVNNAFFNKITGFLPNDHVDYQVTLVELSLYLREKLYLTYPDLKSTNLYNQPIPTHSPDNPKALEHISLTQLVAYMNEVVDVPEDILNAGRAAHLLAGPDNIENQASLHLELLHEKLELMREGKDPTAEQGKALTYLPSRQSATIKVSHASISSGMKN